MSYILAATLLNRSTSEVASGLDGGRVESHNVEGWGLELSERGLWLVGGGKDNSDEA